MQLAGCDGAAKLAGCCQDGRTVAGSEIMSVFKFACPVCGQHIQCDSAKSGSPMECPTCFRKIVVPQAPNGPDSKLLLTAAQVSSRPVTRSPGNGEMSGRRRSVSRATAVFILAGVVVACAAAGSAVAFRHKIFKRTAPEIARHFESPASCGESETNWTLNLAGQKIPDRPVAGRIIGRDFALERATVQLGNLSFRQGARTPQELAVTIQLFARRSEDLSGQTVNIDAGRTNAPKVVLRWKDESDRAAQQVIKVGYAMRIEFGQAAGGRLPGKIYLCLPDHGKSWVAGTFEADIKNPPVPKPPKLPQPAPPPPVKS